MPKIIDRASRRRDVIHAVWRLILNGGMQQATFRAIADETGLAIGSIRHYFGSHEDLIVAAALELSDRVEGRLRAMAENATDSDRIANEALEQVLPLDGDRHDEAILWLTVLTEARLNPALAEPAREMFSGVEEIVRLVFARINYDADDIEVERMCALLDGLATRGVLQPDVVRPERIRAVLERHLASL